MKLVTLIQQLETLSLSLRVGEEDETSLRTALTPIDLFFFLFLITQHFSHVVFRAGDFSLFEKLLLFLMTVRRIYH